MAGYSKYSPIFCDHIIVSLGEGLTLTQFAAEIGVSPSTVRRWRQEFPEFNEACEIALAKAQAYYETVLQGGATGEKSMTREQPGMLTFLMQSRFKDYRKQSEVETDTLAALIPWDKIEVSVTRKNEGA
jgi:transcriptional regulator with XRE-family HTH domain